MFFLRNYITVLNLQNLAIPKNILCSYPYWMQFFTHKNYYDVSVIEIACAMGNVVLGES